MRDYDVNCNEARTGALMNRGDSKAPEPVVWRAGGYLRLSREDRDNKVESASISNQRGFIQSFANDRADISLIDFYEDDGYTGINFDRYGYKRLSEDIENGRINAVIVKDLSRLGRNRNEMDKLIQRRFPSMHVRFIAINDSYDSLYPNPQTDSLVLPLKNFTNETICFDTSLKVRSVFASKRMNGQFIGQFAAYGYMIDPGCKNRLVIDENTAPVVRDIFRWKISGMSQQGIADKLNLLRVLSPLEYKRDCGSKFSCDFAGHEKTKWSAVAVGRILKNDVYIGVLTQGKYTTISYKIDLRYKKPEAEWARVPNAHEAIISQEDFALVEQLMNKDTRVTPGGDSVYLFSGVLHCGDCGRPLVRKPVKGSEYAYYVCSTYKKARSSKSNSINKLDDCTSHSISEKLIYDAVFQTLTAHIRQCAELARLMEFIDDIPFRQANAVKLEKQIEQILAELEKLSRQKLKLYEDFTDGLINKHEYQQFKTAFDARYSKTETALDDLREELSLTVSGNKRRLNVERFKKYLDLQSLTRTVIVEMIERIDVYENKKIVISMQYQDEFEAALACVKSIPEDK